MPVVGNRKHRLKPRETAFESMRDLIGMGFCAESVGSFTQLTADLRGLLSADQRRSAKRSQRRSAVNSSLVIERLKVNYLLV